MNEIPDELTKETDSEAYHKFTQSLSESLDVYKLLLNKKLLSAIEEFQKSEKQIDENVNCGVMSVFEAYDELYNIQQNFHEKICQFIKKVSGI